MPYDNIPTVRATYLDGSFATVVASSQPNILFLGTASKGDTYRKYNVSGIGSAEEEFGADSELMRSVHEAFRQGADNLSVLRVGGKQGKVTIEDDTGKTLTITTSFRDDEILERYSLFIEVDSGKKRILVRDLLDEEFVYDTDEEETINAGVLRVKDTGLTLATVGDLTDLSSGVKLSELTTSDFSPVGGGVINSVTKQAGSDGTAASLVEKYAALVRAYDLLDFRDADIVVPVGVFLDDKNVVDDEAVADFSNGLPVAHADEDELGYLWQYRYQGKTYVYFSDSNDLFSANAELTVQDLEFTAVDAGPTGNAITIEYTSGGTDAVTVTDKAIVVDIDDGVTTASQIKTLIEADVEASALVTVSLGGTGSEPQSAPFASTNLSSNRSYLSHEDLTGDEVPAAVQARFEAGSDVELREANFAHQLASFCAKASTAWKAIFGFISTKGPDSFDRTSIAEWIGSKPNYKVLNGVKYIDTAGDNGTGLLGNKFLAGRSGYRSHMVVGGDSTDGLAYGGFIQTVGRSLPNGEPYGVSDTDEATDSGGKPVDIGKHINVCYDYPVLRNSFNGGTSYRGNIAALVAGKVATMEENREPIGLLGTVSGVVGLLNKHATQEDELSELRMTGLRREDGVGPILVSTKTAAHPTSDYTRLSTIRIANLHLNDIRSIAKRYFGREFTSHQVLSLQQAIDEYLVKRKDEGMNRGARAQLGFSSQDRILGRINIQLRLRPPFVIDDIVVQLTLTADEV